MIILVEHIQEIEELAACNYGPRDIAKSLKLPENAFLKIWNDKESNVRIAFDYGVSSAQATIDKKLFEEAQKGKVTQIQQWQKNKEASQFNTIRTQLLEGLL